MSHSEPEETYLTVAEVAETLKLNQQTVRNWIDQGTLPALRAGGRFVVNFLRGPSGPHQALGLPAHPGAELQRRSGGAEPAGRPERR